MTAASAERTAASRHQATLTGTGALVRFVLRRDRVRLPVWIGALTFVTVSQAASLPGIYTSAEARQARADVIASPAAVALSGPGFGLDDYTFGAMFANEALGFMAVFVALMSLLLVIRHTRHDEAAGRAELVRATVVGRHAPLVAVLVVAVAANLVLGVLTAVATASLGIETIGWTGSWLFGAGLASVGVVFAGVGAVTAQLTEHPRAASGVAGAILGAAYSLRAAGDINRVTGGDGTLSWLSPIGWAQQTAPYVVDRWWPLLLSLAVSAALVAVAVVLSTRRDVGAGFVRPRPGPARASERLASPFALALRQHRTAVVGWSLSLVVFGLGYGTLVGEVQGFVDELDFVTEFLGEGAATDLVDAFLGMLVSLLAIAVGAYCVLAVGKLATEESAGRAEPLLATATSRTRLLASHVAIALGGSALVVVLGAAAIGVTGAATIDRPGLVGELAVAALVYVPVLWLVVGLATALYGWAPRLVPVAWAVVVYGITVSVLGGLLDLPQWLIDASPFELVPRLPLEEFDAVPVVGLSAAAVALLALGVIGFRRRDLQMT